jgi:hypothetical protein
MNNHDIANPFGFITGGTKTVFNSCVFLTHGVTLQVLIEFSCVDLLERDDAHCAPLLGEYQSWNTVMIPAHAAPVNHKTRSNGADEL